MEVYKLECNGCGKTYSKFYIPNTSRCIHCGSNKVLITLGKEVVSDRRYVDSNINN